MTTPDRRLLTAFAASLLLHAAALGHGAFRDLLRPPPARVLQATLRLPAVEAPPAEPLLKNTLDAEPELTPASVAEPPPPEKAAPSAVPRPAKAEARQVRAAQKKLAAHLYYPEEAIARGLEGEVRLILSLTEDGSIGDVQLAASSGHALLDQAAIKAAFAMGRLPGVNARELILPVIFRLQ